MGPWAGYWNSNVGVKVSVIRLGIFTIIQKHLKLVLGYVDFVNELGLAR